MKVLLLTDIHGEVEKLEKIVEKEDFEALLCAGDLSDANKFDDYNGTLEQVLDAFERQGKIAKTVPGNMDIEEDCMKQLIQRRMNIHKKVASFEEFDVVGFGGGTTPFDTPFEPDEEEIRETIEALYPRMRSNTKVAVIHQPPFGSSVDVVDDEHVGSEEVRKLIENLDLDLVLTGHIHESRSIDNISDTAVVNPGPVLEGYYGVAEFGEEITIDMKQI